MLSLRCKLLCYRSHPQISSKWQAKPHLIITFLRTDIYIYICFIYYVIDKINILQKFFTLFDTTSIMESKVLISIKKLLLITANTAATLFDFQWSWQLSRNNTVQRRFDKKYWRVFHSKASQMKNPLSVNSVVCDSV